MTRNPETSVEKGHCSCPSAGMPTASISENRQPSTQAELASPLGPGSSTVRYEPKKIHTHTRETCVRVLMAASTIRNSSKWKQAKKSITTRINKYYIHMKVKVKSISRDQLFATPRTVAYHAPPSMGFSRPEYWSRLPFSSPRDLPEPRIEPRSPALQADALQSEPPGKPLCSRNRILFTNEKEQTDGN